MFLNVSKALADLIVLSNILTLVALKTKIKLPFIHGRKYCLFRQKTLWFLTIKTIGSIMEKKKHSFTVYCTCPTIIIQNVNYE